MQQQEKHMQKKEQGSCEHYVLNQKKKKRLQTQFQRYNLQNEMKKQTHNMTRCT